MYVFTHIYMVGKVDQITYTIKLHTPLPTLIRIHSFLNLKSDYFLSNDYISFKFIISIDFNIIMISVSELLAVAFSTVGAKAVAATPQRRSPKLSKMVLCSRASRTLPRSSAAAPKLVVRAPSLWGRCGESPTAALA